MFFWVPKSQFTSFPPGQTWDSLQITLNSFLWIFKICWFFFFNVSLICLLSISAATLTVRHSLLLTQFIISCVPCFPSGPSPIRFLLCFQQGVVVLKCKSEAWKFVSDFLCLGDRATAPSFSIKGLLQFGLLTPLVSCHTRSCFFAPGQRSAHFSVKGQVVSVVITYSSIAVWKWPQTIYEWMLVTCSNKACLRK